MTAACSLLEELAHINSFGFIDCVSLAVTRLSRVHFYKGPAKPELGAWSVHFMSEGCPPYFVQLHRMIDQV